MRVQALLLPLLVVGPLLSLNCSDDAVVTTTPDASASSSGTSGAATSSSGASGSGSSSGGSSEDGCGTTKACVDIEIDDKGEGYRVAVIWFQLDDDAPVPVDATYDREVPAGTKKIEVALSDVPATKDERELLCDRADATTPCTSDPKIGYAVLIAYRDTNKDGKPQVFYEKGDEVLGEGNFVIGWSAKTYDGTNWGEKAAQWGQLWPTGIDAGVHLYQLDRPEAGAFDRPVKSTTGQRNKLTEKGPNLT